MGEYIQKSDADLKLDNIKRFFQSDSVKRRLTESQSSALRAEIEESIRLVDQAEAGLDELSHRLSQRLESLAGAELANISQSWENAVRYLQDSQPNLRRAALYVMAERWPSHDGFPHLCEEIAFRDGDIPLRCQALSCLGGTCYGGSNDSRIGVVLARLVLTQSEPEAVRKASYFALFHLRGVSVHSMPPLTGFRFPEDVDWTFVWTFIGDSL